MTAVNWTNFTDFADLPAAANTASNGGFWVGMLYMMWIILLLMLSSFGFEVAIVTSSFFPTRLNARLKYLVDKNGNLTITWNRASSSFRSIP